MSANNDAGSPASSSSATHHHEVFVVRIHDSTHHATPASPVNKHQ